MELHFAYIMILKNYYSLVSKITFNQKPLVFEMLLPTIVLLLFTLTDWTTRQIVGNLTNQTRVY